MSRKKKIDKLQERFQLCCDFEEHWLNALSEELDGIKRLAKDGQMTETRQFNGRICGLQTFVFQVCQARKNRKDAQREMLCQ